MKHKHHIIPRHAGGSDDPSNLFECTIPEHAELHFALYLEHGRHQDWYASMGLSGNTEEVERLRRQRVSEYRKGCKMSDESKKRMSDSLKKKHSERSSWFRKKRHWYTNGTEEIITEECPPGFRPGRLFYGNQSTLTK